MSDFQWQMDCLARILLNILRLQNLFPGLSEHGILHSVPVAQYNLKNSPAKLSNAVHIEILYYLIIVRVKRLYPVVSLFSLFLHSMA